MLIVVDNQRDVKSGKYVWAGGREQVGNYMHVLGKARQRPLWFNLGIGISKT